MTPKQIAFGGSSMACPVRGLEACIGPASLEEYRARDLFYRGELTERVLAQTEILAKSGRDHDAIRELHWSRGKWSLARGKPAAAIESFAEGMRMSREVGDGAASYKALLALSRLRAGMDFDARSEAERLSKIISGSTRNKTLGALAVAELWHGLGERDAAVEQALRAHRWAAADGEPYARRYYLDRTRALLSELGATLPEVPRYDPSTTPPYPWEKDIRALAKRLRAERLRAQQERRTAAPRISPPGTPQGSARRRMRAGRGPKAQ